MRMRLSIIIPVIMFGIITIFCGGCKKQEPAKLTVSVEGKELSDAYILIDERYAGNLTQTVIKPDRKVYINGIFAAKAPGLSSDEGEDTYSGCTDTLVLTAGRHTLTLWKGEAKNLQIIIDISPGHHLLVYFSDKALVKWDNKLFQVGPSRKVIVASE